MCAEGDQVNSMSSRISQFPFIFLARSDEVVLIDFRSILSHAGDGNFHAIILFNPEDKGEVEEAQRLSNEMVHTALALEGKLMRT